MKKLTVSELFRGYKDIDIPEEIDRNLPFNLTVSEYESNKRSLLFITEKVGKEKDELDVSKIKTTPGALVISKSQSVIQPVCPLIKAMSVRCALSYALSNAYEIDYDKMKIIGVTGTNGKSTTATLIYRILQACGYKVGFIGTGKVFSDSVLLTGETYSMTTPDPTELYPFLSRMAKNGCKYVVMEVSSHSIALNKIAPIKFEYSIFTNLDNDHLDFHKTKEEYFKTKLRLFESSKRGLFNLDDEYSRKAAELSKCKKSTFGIIYQGDAYATEIESNIRGTSFFYREENLIFKAESALIGSFNTYNILAALKCVIDLGIKPCLAKNALKRVAEVDGRMEIIPGEITAIIDYAHTPSAFYNCLKTLKQNIKHKQNITLVFGCGGNRDVAKRSIFGQYAELYADKIIITEDNSRHEDFNSIVKDITANMKNNKHKVIQDRECAIRYAFETSLPGDLVAVVGKGHEKYKIVGDNYISFNEKELIKSILNDIGDIHENNP